MKGKTMRRQVIIMLMILSIGALPIATAQDPTPIPDPFDEDGFDDAFFDELGEFDEFGEFVPDFEIPPLEGEFGEFDEFFDEFDEFDDFEPEPEFIPPPPEPIVPSTLQLLISARIDIETLAGVTLGATRPEGWSGSTDSTAPDFAITIRLDLEVLTRSLVGEVPPDGWFGVVASSPYAIARDIRHDLELIADAVELVPRPANWAGGTPLLRCDRATQALVVLLDETTDFTLQADRTAPDFCRQASREASTFAELLISGRTAQGAVVGTTTTAAPTTDPRITADDAVGFINLDATARGGVFPVGERLELVARQTGAAGFLMLVRGVGFELFVDYRQTNVTAEQFAALRSVGGLRVDPRCNADWCD